MPSEFPTGSGEIFFIMLVYLVGGAVYLLSKRPATVDPAGKVLILNPEGIVQDQEVFPAEFGFPFNMPSENQIQSRDLIRLIRAAAADENLAGVLLDFSNTDFSIATLKGPGVAMGVDCNFIYSENHRDRLEPGDVLLIGTDGIWETSDPDGKQFGKHRLEQIMLENTNRTASEICDSLMDEVNHFRGDQKPEDDVSGVVIKVPE